jgi:hypothetical protein
MAELYDQNLVQWLQDSGEYIGRVRPADERTAWIMFLLEQVEPFLSAEENTALLSEVQAMIQERLGRMSNQSPGDRGGFG